jgi:hypothetical protein
LHARDRRVVVADLAQDLVGLFGVKLRQVERASAGIRRDPWDSCRAGSSTAECAALARPTATAPMHPDRAARATPSSASRRATRVASPYHLPSRGADRRRLPDQSVEWRLGSSRRSSSHRPCTSV